MDSKEFLNCKQTFYQNNKLNFFLTVLFQIIVAIINISLAFFIMYMIESITSRNVTMFRNTLVVMLGVVIVFIVVSTLLKKFKNAFIKKALGQFKSYVFEKILAKPIGEFNNSLSSQVISSFSNDLHLIESNYLNANVMIINYAVMLVAALIAMGSINLFMVFSVVAVSLIPLIISLIVGNKLVDNEKKASDENESFVDQMKDLLNGFIVIKSFRAENEVLNLFSTKNASLEETKKNRRDTNDVMVLASQLSTFLVVSIIFVLGIYFSFTGTMTIATVIACIQLSNYITEPLKFLMPMLSNKKASVKLIEKIANVIGSNGNDMKPNEQKRQVKLDSFSSSIALNNVSFGYDKEKKILDGIDLKFEKGKSYAIVGGSGSGKSTLLKLLLGYYDTFEGEIQIDDADLNTITYESLYEKISVVQQNVFLFDKSIKDNVTMFKKFHANQLEQAIYRSGLEDLILEKGTDYDCGEGGSNLSGGEKQRVSIARCLLRNAPVLLMDEATGALDNRTAFKIENDILAMQDLTRIIVTHKLEEKLLDKYDEIVVLKEGQVCEMGTFDYLINKKGYFYSLYNVTKAA